MKKRIAILDGFYILCLGLILLNYSLYSHRKLEDLIMSMFIVVLLLGLRIFTRIKAKYNNIIIKIVVFVGIAGVGGFNLLSWLLDKYTY